MKDEDKASKSQQSESPQPPAAPSPPSLWEHAKKTWQWGLGALSAALGCFASLPQEIKAWFLNALPWILERVLPWLIALSLFTSAAFYLYRFSLRKFAILAPGARTRLLAQVSFWALFCLGLTAISFSYWGFVNEQEAFKFNKSGLKYLEENDPDRALQEFNKAWEINPNFAAIYANRGQVYAKKGDFDLALKDYDSALELNPQYAEAYNYRGLVFYKKGKFDQAIQDYSKAIELNPQYAEAYNNRGFAYDDKPRKRDESIYDAEATRGTEDHKRAMELGLNSKEIILVAHFDGPKEARLTEFILEHLRKTLKGYRNNVEVRPLDQVFNAITGSEMARKVGQEQQATIVIWGWYERGKKVSSVGVHFDALKNSAYIPGLSGEIYKLDSAQLESFAFQEHLAHDLSYLSLAILGFARSQMGNWDDAIELYTVALSQPATTISDLKEYEFQLYLKRANAYNRKQAYAAAIQDCTKAIAIYPQDESVYNTRGFAYGGKGEYDRAIQDYTKALALNPNYTPAYLNRGNFYNSKGEHDHAIQDFNKVLEINPNNIYAYNNRGFTYNYKGEYDRAIQDFNKALEINPKDAAVYLNRGNAYSEKGEYDRAIQDCNKALEINPKYAVAYNNRGWVYANKGELESAIRDLNKALELNPNQAETYHSRGYTYTKQGELDKALQDFNKAAKLDPKQLNIYHGRGQVYRQKGEKAKAIADFKQALQLKPQPAMRQELEQWLKELAATP